MSGQSIPSKVQRVANCLRPSGLSYDEVKSVNRQVVLFVFLVLRLA